MSKKALSRCAIDLSRHALIRVVKSLKESYLNGSTIQDMEKTFTELKTVLEKNQGIPYDVEIRTHNVNERGKGEMERFARDLKSIETKLDAILLDIKLPWVDGYELCKLIKQHDEFKKVPLVFLSGKKSEIEVKKGFEMGCDEYVTKPFDIEEIKKTVKNLIRLK